MRKLICGVLTTIIVLSCLLSGCQIGSYVIGGEYYSSPKEAFNSQASMSAVSGLYGEISSEIGIYAINSDYAVCLAMMDYTRNGEFVSSEPSALLMKTKGQEYYFMGNYCEGLNFEIVEKCIFRAEGVNYYFYVGKEDVFNTNEFSEEKFKFYETMVEVNCEKYNLKIAIGDSEKVA